MQHYEEDVNRRYEREMEYFVDYALTGSGESLQPARAGTERAETYLGETYNERLRHYNLRPCRQQGL